jgi:3-oxoacyl-[acyl-carrier protein] reductase
MTDIRPIMLITGSRKGIGRYLAEYYLQHSYIVIGCSRENSDLKHKNYIHFCADVSNKDGSVNTLFNSIYHNFGRLDVLINNAGIASMNSFLFTSAEMSQRIMDVNFFGTFLCSREAAKIMMKFKTGRIVNISTVAVPLRLKGEAVYAASKAAVNMLTQVMAAELASMGITVNAVGPTPIKTDLIKNVPQDKLKALLAQLPQNQFSTVEDISNVIDFFIKPESSAITGQIIYLGGV